jgi:hypothetical protein
MPWIHIVLDFGHFLCKKKSFFPAQCPGFWNVNYSIFIKKIIYKVLNLQRKTLYFKFMKSVTLSRRVEKYFLKDLLN